jgi:peptidoglycan lytic transglycosylase
VTCSSRLASWLAITLTVAGLAGCAQSPANIGASELSVGHHRAALPAKRHRSVIARVQQAPQSAAVGLASFYTGGSRTASGEKLVPGELTAAHPTLPFGTQLRVTRLDTGRSVVVRVNDRGPFIKGRVVDVSHSAAEQLGLTHQGLAKVKIDVVQ